MRKKMIIDFEIETDELAELMEREDLTLDEAINQELADGNLDLNEVFFSDIRLEDIPTHPSQKEGE